MNPTSYCHRFRLPFGRAAVFALFADPHSLDLVTPRWFRLQPIEAPVRLEPGAEIDYRLRWRGLPLRWTSRVTDWVEPEFFAYEQKRGPYRFFRHEHSFTAVPGGTEVVDRVVFTAPGGALAAQLIALPDLRRIFEFRERRALELLQAGLGARRIPRTSASSSAIDLPT